MRVVFAGTPEVAVPSLDALLESAHEVVAVVTRPDANAGRGRKPRPSPVAERAQRAGVEILRPHRAGDPAFLERLGELAPDCCPVVAYGALLPSSALEIPRYGWVNLHFSVLPSWRGAAPVQHAILHGDDVTGATTFRIVPELDAGPVFGTVTEPVRPRDTSGDLLERLSNCGAELLVRTLDGIAAQTLVPQPQPPDGVTYAGKLTSDDAQVDWSNPAPAVDRLIRACTPTPGAWTTFRGTRLKLGPVDPAARAGGEHGLEPGQVAATKQDVLVGTASHPVVLGEVQPQGKRRMSAVEWARGSHPDPDERLGSIGCAPTGSS
ncbi:methionyl-tRNA formyltransferase [Lipingzhangella sp. LS1_29]|uniref:Methionyl-tRNA formyltransferase n=1 Tax=Lipingzhangella rawalii TaxID=2055835 RepID=A0ABU2H2D7_9ACTN|nr:methionyl-tRNA formyltransferase [Lipingzhangella rawalii]MDS1269453.1 methionyl-tRNA formyltransferase [Lipingzhangella rawalii]